MSALWRSIVIGLILFFQQCIVAAPYVHAHTGMPTGSTVQDQKVEILFEWSINMARKKDCYCMFLMTPTDIDGDSEKEIIVVYGDNILCVSGASGKVEWNITVNLTYTFLDAYREIFVSPTGDGQIVIANGEKIFSIDALRGVVLWNTTLEEEICGIFQANNSILAVTNTSITCIENGTVWWSRKFDGLISVAFSPKSDIFVVCYNGRLLALDWNGTTQREIDIGAQCVMFPQNLLLIDDVDLDNELEVFIPLENDTVIILSLDSFSIEYSLILPQNLYWYSIGALNPNNIPDLILLLSTESEDPIIPCKAVVWLDFSKTIVVDLGLEFPNIPETYTDVYLLTYDIDHDGWGDIIFGSSAFEEICILLNLKVPIVKYFHGWDIVMHQFDKLYVMDITNDLYPEIVLSEQSEPNIGNLMFIDGLCLSKKQAVAILMHNLSMWPPILIENLDNDESVEIVGVYTQHGTEDTLSIVAYEVEDAEVIYASMIHGIPYIQMVHDEDMDNLPSNLESKIGTNSHIFDTDGDTLPDGWEYMNRLDPLDSMDATLDYDGDELNNTMEYAYGGDPWDNDTDDDGLSDHDEAQIGTDLRLNDTDGDGMLDGWEYTYDLNATSPSDGGLDSDGDGLVNVEEYRHNTNPMDPDTDGDGYSDGCEVSHGTDPLDPTEYPSLDHGVVSTAPSTWYWLVLVLGGAIVAVLLVFMCRWRVFGGRK